MKQLKKIASYVLIFAMLLLAVPKTALAAAMSVNISGSGQYAVGDSFTVNLSTSGEGSYVAQGTLTYDPAVLSCSGASGTILFTSNSGAIVSAMGAGSFTFTCIATGNTAINAVNVTGYDVESMEDLQINVAAATVSVVPKETPRPLSSDASLTGLLTSLGRVNAADGSWTLSCGNEVKDFAIAPEVAAGAKWTASGDFNNLKEGENLFTITVTAEDGVTQKNYTIKVVRAAAPATSAPEQTQPSESATEEPSSEETGSEAEESLTVKLFSGEELFVAAAFDEEVLPEGYEKIIYEYKGTEIEAASAENGVVLFYLTEEEDGEGTFYVYDEESGKCAPFLFLSCDQGLTILPLPKKTEVPKGYEEIELQIGDETVAAWAMEDEERYCLVYGVYTDGEEGFYRYDKEQGTFFRYEEAEGSDLSLEELQQKNQQLAAKYEEDMQIRNIICIALGVLCLILLILVIILLARRKKNTPPSGDGETPVVPLAADEDEDDWKLFEDPEEEEEEIPVEGSAEEAEAAEVPETDPEEEMVLPEEEQETVPEVEEEKPVEESELTDFEASIQEILRQSFPARMEDWMNQEDELAGFAETPAEEPEEITVEETAEETKEEPAGEFPEEPELPVLPPIEDLWEEEELTEETPEEEPAFLEAEEVEDLFEEADSFDVSKLYGETKVDGVDIEEDLDVYFSKKPDKHTKKKNKNETPKVEAPAVEEDDDDGFEFIEF